MSKPAPLTVVDRSTGRTFLEFMDDSPSTYESHPRFGGQWLQSQPPYDWLVALWQNTRWSARKIKPFVRKYKIDMSEFEPGPFKSYADFFDRRFLPGKRSFPSDPAQMGAFGEARYFGWKRLDPAMAFPVKGAALEPATLLGGKERVAPFTDGPVILARLSPVDYHHLHFPDCGYIRDEAQIGGRLWTVNPPALRNQPDILFRNERHIQWLQTDHFGQLAMVEVGALSVGRIVQVDKRNDPFRRGAEKSVFEFGGSAVVLFGEKGAWLPASDIIANTQQGMETFIRLGDVIAANLRNGPKPVIKAGAARNERIEQPNYEKRRE
jgi:phosphatidylserine decarboxylase